MTLRHVISINDLSLEEIESVFSLADHYLGTLGDPDIPFRIGTSTNECAGSVMAALFYEPSTRTRLSFESAMLRLGGKTISSADPATSSAAKGESLADAIRIVSGYADLIVLRHPRDGAARLAAQFASIPVINGGDGAHEHPTQTLCDLYTLKREKGRLEALNVALVGDLYGSRTVHSLVYALARFGANVILMPAAGMALPQHVERRLRNEFRYAPAAVEIPELGTVIRGACVPQSAKGRPISGVDALYVTRFQKERWPEGAKNYPLVDSRFLALKSLENALVMHPLPRVDELDPAVDVDQRAAYFRQASYGVPIRMALVSLLLNTTTGTSRAMLRRAFHPHENALRPQAGPLCANTNCITRFEPQNAPSSFTLVGGAAGQLRCLYCEHDRPDS